MLRKLVITLLKECAVNRRAYNLMVDWIDNDIRRAVEGIDNLYYLPDDWEEGEEPPPQTTPDQIYEIAPYLGCDVVIIPRSRNVYNGQLVLYTGVFNDS